LKDEDTYVLFFSLLYEHISWIRINLCKSEVIPFNLEEDEINTVSFLVALYVNYLLGGTFTHYDKLRRKEVQVH
jgi:hypothetical protein